MIRFSYTDRRHMDDISCKDCEKRRNCLLCARHKSLYQRERTEVCDSLVKIKRGIPQVSNSESDCRMLIHQLSISQAQAQTILQQHRNNSLYEYKGFKEEIPTIEECWMFIDLMKTILNHIFEFREMYGNCEKDLTDLIQTVIRVEDKNVFVYLDNIEKTAIKILQKSIKESVDNFGFSYFVGDRENLLRENILESTE